MPDQPRIGRPIFRLEIQSAPAERSGTRDGWVYLADEGKGLLKAGRARNAPRGAARDWKPHVVAYARVEDRYVAENTLLKALAPFRVVGTKLYRLSGPQAVSLMREHFGEVTVVPQGEQ